MARGSAVARYAQEHAECSATEARLTHELAGAKEALANANAELASRSKLTLDHAIALERISKLEAERDALLAALVDAHRTRKR